MIELKNFDELLVVQEKEKNFILYLKTGDCNVCDALLPKIEALEKNSKVKFYYANIMEAQDIKGQVIVFTVPTILLYKSGQETKRHSRFIVMNDLKNDIENIYE